MSDFSNLLIPRFESDGGDDTHDRLLSHIDSTIAGKPCFDDDLWSLAAVARWIQERTPEAVDGLTIDERLLMDTLINIHKALRSGDVTAYAISSPEATSRPIPKETWSTYSLGYKEHLAFLKPVVALQGSEINDTFQHVKLKRPEVMRRWPADGNQAMPPSTAGAEHECFVFLKALMRASPDHARAKADVKEHATHRFGGLSARGFDRAWRRAVEETGAVAWSQPGRKT